VEKIITITLLVLLVWILIAGSTLTMPAVMILQNTAHLLG
jgi:hypothetical protein